MSSRNAPPLFGGGESASSPALEAVRAIGDAVGARLAAEKAASLKPATAAAELVSVVLRHDPTCKLPELLGQAEVADWMAATGVSRSNLRHAITSARKAARRAPAETTRGKPPRASGRLDRPTSERHPPGDGNRGGLFRTSPVPTQDLADL